MAYKRLLKLNSTLGHAIADYLPAWAGGLPRDAPPRPGTDEYDAFKKRMNDRAVGPLTAASMVTLTTP